MATLTNGESATLSLDAFASVSVQCDGGVQGTLAWVSSADNLKSDVSAKLTNKTYGPYGVPGSMVITVTAGSLIYTVNGNAGWIERNADGAIVGLVGDNDQIFDVSTKYSGRRGTRRGIKQVDFGSADVTVGNHPLVAGTNNVAKSSGKARVTANDSMAAGGVYGCYATPLFNDFSDGTMIYLDIDFPDQGNTMVFSLWFYDATFAVKSATANVWVAGIAKPGRMVLAVPKSEFTLGGTFATADWANIGQVGVLASKVGGTPVNVTERFDVYSVWSGWPAKAAVVLALDDSNNQLPEVYSGLNNGGLGMPHYGIPLTLYSIPSQWGQVGSATLAEMRLAYDAGWDVAIHTVDVLALVGQTLTWAAGVATFTSLLENHGFSNGNSVLIAGADPYDLNGTKTITVTGATTFTYATAQSGSGTALGYITCNKTAGGAVTSQVAIVKAERSIAAAAGLTRGNDHFAYASGVWSPTLDTAIRAEGFLSTRSVAGMNDAAVPTALSGTNGLLPSLTGAFTGGQVFDHPLTVVNLNENTPVTLAKVLACVDLAIKYGGVLIIYGHSIVSATSTPNLEWLTTKWWPLVQGLKARQDNGLLDCLTITQAYESVNTGSDT